MGPPTGLIPPTCGLRLPSLRMYHTNGDSPPAKQQLTSLLRKTKKAFVSGDSRARAAASSCATADPGRLDPHALALVLARHLAVDAPPRGWGRPFARVWAAL